MYEVIKFGRNEAMEPNYCVNLLFKFQGAKWEGMVGSNLGTFVQFHHHSMVNTPTHIRDLGHLKFHSTLIE